MIVGENSRPEDMNVNPTKEKKLSNMRAVGHDRNILLKPARRMSLEEALEFIADDESIEVTSDTNSPAEGSPEGNRSPASQSPSRIVRIEARTPPSLGWRPRVDVPRQHPDLAVDRHRGDVERAQTPLPQPIATGDARRSGHQLISGTRFALYAEIINPAS